MKDKKTLGILGGMGPRATAHFFNKLLERTNAGKDWEHLHIIIDSNVHIPSRTRAILYGEESPVKEMKKSCFRLMDMGCDYIGVPCNSAHYFYEDVMKGNNIPWVNMIGVISESLKEFDRVLVMGGYAIVVEKMYDKYMDNTVYLNDYSFVFELIEKIKTNQDCYNELIEFYEEAEHLDIDCILLACTELPIVINDNYYKKVYIANGNNIYIDKLIEMGGAEVNYD